MRKQKNKSQIEAVKKANTGKKLSRKHIRRIKQGLKKHDKSMIVKAFNPDTN